MNNLLPDNTIPALLKRGLRDYADRDAFVVDDIRETYRELFDNSLEVARGLIGLGAVPGDRVVIIMHNSLELIHVLFGCALARVIAVPVNARLAPRELAHIVQDCGAKYLFTGDKAVEHVDLVARINEAFPALSATGLDPAAPQLEAAFLLGDARQPGFLGWTELLAAADGIDGPETLALADLTDPEDPYMLMYTSGTTANPKGCTIPHRAIVSTGYVVGRSGFKFTKEDKMWNALPFFHVSAQAPMTGVLDAGATYVSMLHFEAVSGLQLIRDEGATVLFAAYPALTQPLLSTAGDDVAGAFAKVRAILTVGPADLLAKYQAQLPPHTIHISCYGSTELGGIAVMGQLDDPAEARFTSGLPLPGLEMEIRDLDTGAIMPPNQGGVIWMKGYALFTEYLNDASKTSEVMDDAGWFNTGDLGRVDEKGYLTFLGRTKDMLKVGGENVACIEIESYLTSHPAVAMTAVIGRPDAKYDEVPIAFVELIPGRTATAEELLEFAAKGLAKFKVPREVRIVTEWPMSATKIQKFKLKELLEPVTQ